MTPSEGEGAGAAGAAVEHPVAEVLLCPSCTSPVAAGERFCEACGADLGPPTANAAARRNCCPNGCAWCRNWTG